MWFETLTSLELDRLIEFEATHCLIVAAVKGARLIMYLRVPGFEKMFPLSDMGKKNAGGGAGVR